MQLNFSNIDANERNLFVSWVLIVIEVLIELETDQLRDISRSSTSRNKHPSKYCEKCKGCGNKIEGVAGILCQLYSVGNVGKTRFNAAIFLEFECLLLFIYDVASSTGVRLSD